MPSKIILWILALGAGKSSWKNHINAIIHDNGIESSPKPVFASGADYSFLVAMSNERACVSYMESLESGIKVPEHYTLNGIQKDVVNEGEVLDPLASQQYEIGAKTKIGHIALDAALFRIEKSLQYYDLRNPDAIRYVQDGLQVHQGIELTATGNLTDNLNLIGGFTWLDPEVKEQSQNPEYESKAPTDVAEQIVKARLEYQLPFIRNLSLSAAANYNGSSYGDLLNEDKVPSYTLFDIGARYQTEWTGKLVTFRADLHNLTNEHYWNGFNGTRIGDPRTFMVSGTVEF